MKHINTLELKFYDNIKAHLSRIDKTKLKNVEYVNKNEIRVPITNASFQTIRNFYEYYVDGKSLYKEIHFRLWNKRLSHSNYAYEEIGVIGAFNAISDWVEVQTLSLSKEKNYYKNFLQKVK